MAFKDPEKAKAYYRSYEETHREEHAARQRAYVQRQIEKRGAEQVSEEGREYWRANAAEISERRRVRRQADPDYAEKHAARQRRYRDRHPEIRATDRARRRMRVTVEFTAEDRAESMAWRRLIKDDACYYCGAPETHHVDHYISLVNGGTEHWWNLVRACRTCNQRKNRMNGDEFLRLLGKDDIARPA